MLVGVGLALVLIVGGAVVWLAQRGDDGGSASSPAAAPNVAQAGGETTGQAKELTDALTGKGLECSVRFTIAAGGSAGCFSWADKGMTSAEVLFQYDNGGTVIGLNLKTFSQQEGVAFVTLAPVLQTVSEVVFDADQDKVARAVSDLPKTDDATFDGSWGRYHVREGASGTTVSAAKSGKYPLTVPRIEMASSPAKLADALTAKGFTCDAAREDCSGSFRDGKGRTSVLSAGLGSSGITTLIIGATDTSRDADAATTKQTFTELVGNTLGIAGGNGLPDVQKWSADHLDGQSHSAYVGGWRVDLVVKYGTAYGDANLASSFGVTVSTDSLWTVPSQ
ncbi:hypothetical protein [Kribbella monticola]|uniref:hypothetical protein n=1 Tax=Kribbella monticola TaxID=2185285 RepID=UPI001300B8A1|nr:hypothetical protein [Kribbella monticola]